jgi:pyruvate kinase
MERFTKILATVGPAVDSKEKIMELVKAGANAFRLNFSHGEHDEHAQ